VLMLPGQKPATLKQLHRLSAPKMRREK